MGGSSRDKAMSGMDAWAGIGGESSRHGGGTRRFSGGQVGDSSVKTRITLAEIFLRRPMALSTIITREGLVGQAHDQS